MKHTHGHGLKIFLRVAVALMVVFAFSAAAFAAPGADAAAVAEAPHVRVVIDGAAGSYTDTPIEINSRILLPFREILTKLGVPNDDDHIIWNEEEESVTVKDGKNEIRLVIGNPDMTLNGEVKTFDVAPYFYEKNNRTYVPVRAVSELLNKKVMWEDASSTVYVRNAKNYEETVALLKKVQDAGTQKKVQAVADCKIKLKLSTDGAPIPGADSDGVLSMTMDLTQDIKADLDNDVMFVGQKINVMGTRISSDMYILNKKAFVKIDAPGAEWTDVAAESGMDMGTMLDQISMVGGQMDSRPPEDVAMGLTAVKGADGSYSLTGELVNISDVNKLLNNMTGMMATTPEMEMKMTISKFQIGEKLNKDLTPAEAIMTLIARMEVKETDGEGGAVTIIADIDMNMNVKYESVGPDFEVVVPDAVKKLAGK